MSIEEYRIALKNGKKTYRTYVQRGQSPYLPILEQLIDNVEVFSQESLGLLEIPLEQITGTYYAGRQQAFSVGFQPLMDVGTEFAQKWIALCGYHEDVGIQTPIEVYEWMHRFYVVEGHKRVSVLKHFEAVCVPAMVTRLLPQVEDSVESRIYQEFLHFHYITGNYFLQFDHEGGFTALLQGMQSNPDKPWDTVLRKRFHSFYLAFSAVYQEKAEGKLTLAVGDAMLIYCEIYGFESALKKTLPVLRTELALIWVEICNRDMNAEIHLLLDPPEQRPRLLPFVPVQRVRVTFIHTESADTSRWVYAHELGRRDLEHAFAGRVETVCLDGASTQQRAENAIDCAIAEGSDLIFTTSPQLLSASVKAAVKNPQVKILNCSLNTAHPSIRTYSARMYEAKFLMGMLAGSLTQEPRIGYVADYPIVGSVANINAFALGARMVNAHVQVQLEWSKTCTQDHYEKLREQGVCYIADQDMIAVDGLSPHRVGLYRYAQDTLSNVALCVWQWGKLYEKIVQSYLSGSWKNDENGTRAINYWWGMDTGVVNFICSRSLPPEAVRLVHQLKQDICAGTFQPFADLLHTQHQGVLDFRKQPMTAEEIMKMDWLCAAVQGNLPDFDQLLPEAQTLVQLQGI